MARNTMKYRYGQRALRLAVPMALLVAMAACTTVPTTIPGFYDATASQRAGAPGSLIRVRPLAGAPGGATAYKVLYRSTGLDGKPIAVSGVVIVPRGTPPPGGRRIVAWAHPTTGVARGCAPSLYGSVFRNVMGLRDMLARGYIVTATDYPGLGTAGAHPYLVGVSEARAVLDSVRAARALPGVQASRDFAAWGHSQGGHAVMWTGQIARRYAPDLRLVGLAAAAPATDLARLFDLDRTEFAGRVLSAMTIWSWSHVFGYPTRTLVNPSVTASYRQVAASCSESFVSGIEGYLAEKRLEKTFLLVNPTKIEPWRGQMIRNTPGAAPVGAPVFLAQGLKDTIVRPVVTKAYARRLCRQGGSVRLELMPGITHHLIAKKSATKAVTWMAARFAGAPAPGTCRRVPR